MIPKATQISLRRQENKQEQSSSSASGERDLSFEARLGRGPNIAPGPGESTESRETS